MLIYLNQKESFMEMIELLKDFKPAKQFRLYNGILTCFYIFVIWLCFAWIVFIDEFMFLNVFIAGLLVILLVIGIVWNILYYDSIVYHLNKTEMTWRRGVWFKQTGIVPYTRITNVDIVQGPLMRMFEISNLRIQTAGYSAQKVAEISIKGMEEPEPLREMIMDFVRDDVSLSAATGGGDASAKKRLQGSDQEITEELKKIRQILEKIAEK
ncbi:membrane protein YdbS with pleckstrin-like domain [Methanomicrobium sp. W14]|uniref:PH domain-containing protein n=1 Tax=Methanomicrobium sp. W14 TaxID=2817839 RepID=UPI001FD8816C|nr:PH domain-containing protein [Methanomicrobium sp. W14]MBP2134013.1 membrane protein YdbS with pleckstrin-like domain [Methanomicrobium sp. W14]